MRQRRPSAIAGLVDQIKAEGTKGREIDDATRYLTDPNFRTLQIGHDPDGYAGGFLHRAYRRQPGLVVSMHTVAEIQPEHIGPRRVQPGDHVEIAAGRAQRGNNLCGAFPSHERKFILDQLELRGSR
jgi:hypothetical protein